MTVVITFENVTPISRADGNAWTDARIEEAATATGSYTAIETIDLSTLPGGLDSDPLNPASRTLTTEEGTADGLWYRIVFVDADGDESAPTDPIQNVSTGSAYATVDELFRVLKVRTPTADQTLAAARVLAAAAAEINDEIDFEEDSDPLSSGHLALAAQVNLERAAELWQLQEVHFGIVGIGSEVPLHIARDTWEKHAITLSRMKQQWGFA